MDFAELGGELYVTVASATVPMLRYDGEHLEVVTSGILDLPLPTASFVGHTDDGLILNMRFQHQFGSFGLVEFDSG
jgi:hypothetical protein